MMLVQEWSSQPGYQAYGKNVPIASILLIKVDHVGDFILAFDAIAEVVRRFPGASIDLVCAPWNAAIARSLKIFRTINTLHLFGEKAEAGLQSCSLDTVQEVLATPYDLAVDLRVDPDSRFLLNHVTAIYKCGYESPQWTSGVTMALPRQIPPEASWNLAFHQGLLMLRLVHSIGDLFRTSSTPAHYLRDRVATEPKLDLDLDEDRLLVVCNTSSGRAAKNWPIDRFKTLIGWLCNRMEVTVLMLGAKDQLQEVDEIIAFCRSPLAKSAVARTNLQEAVALIAKADLFIGNDSGLTHIAARLGVPTVGIYSGIDPTAIWAPVGTDVTVIKAPVPCSPCHILDIQDCHHDHICIDRIGDSYVRSVVRRKLLAIASRPLKVSAALRDGDDASVGFAT